MSNRHSRLHIQVGFLYWEQANLVSAVGRGTGNWFDCWVFVMVYLSFVLIGWRMIVGVSVFCMMVAVGSDGRDLHAVGLTIISPIMY